MSNTIPERFLENPANLLVIHESDMHAIDMARMSLYALVDMAGDGTPSQCRLSIDREQLAYLLENVADKLKDIPEVGFVHVVQSRANFYTQQTQGV